MDDAMKAAIAVAEMDQGRKLEAYLARGRPLEALTDSELTAEWRKGLIEWAKDSASFDKTGAIPGDDAAAEMSLRGISPEYSEDDHATFARAVEKQAPAHEAQSPEQREGAIRAMMERYQSESTKRH